MTTAEEPEEVSIKRKCELELHFSSRSSVSNGSVALALTKVCFAKAVKHTELVSVKSVVFVFM